MKTNLKLSSLALGLLVVACLTGCASTKVSNRQQLVTGPLPKPATVWVYDFVATPADLPADSVLSGQPDLDTTVQTDTQIAEGKKLGHQIATELVTQINGLGMKAALAAPTTKPQINDLVLRGYLLSVTEGSAAKRVGIGFGSGGSELRTAVEGFQMTATGLRKLGSGTVEAGGSKGPGTAVGLAVFIATANPVGLIVSTGTKVYGEASGSSKVEGRAKATAKEITDVLKTRFTEQGWID